MRADDVAAVRRAVVREMQVAIVPLTRHPNFPIAINFDDRTLFASVGQNVCLHLADMRLVDHPNICIVKLEPFIGC